MIRASHQGEGAAEGGEQAQAGAQQSGLSRQQRRAAARQGRRAGAPVAPPQQAQAGQQSTVRRERPKVGRNDPCYCGSGKKYKNCHYREDQAEAASQ